MELTIKNDLNEIERVAQFVETFAEGHLLPPKLAFEINLALEELVTNVISYGYDDTGEHLIRLTLDMDGEDLDASIEDDARPFNPLDAPPPDINLPLEDRPIGGLGIHLVKNMFDTLAYSWENGKNKLTLRKNQAAQSLDDHGSQRQ